MAPALQLDPLLVAELERLIAKLAEGARPGEGLTPREAELVARLRRSRDVVLGQLHGVLRSHRGLNDRGRDKILRLAEASESICERPS